MTLIRGSIKIDEDLLLVTQAMNQVKPYKTSSPSQDKAPWSGPSLAQDLLQISVCVLNCCLDASCSFQWAVRSLCHILSSSASNSNTSQLDTVKQAHLHNNGETSDLSIYIKYPEFDLAGGWCDGCRFGRRPRCRRLQRGPVEQLNEQWICPDGWPVVMVQS